LPLFFILQPKPEALNIPDSVRIWLMERLLILLVCILSVFIPIGCQNSTKLKSGVDVIVDGDGQFPASLAGTWKSNDGIWEIVFGPDGTISSAVISLGRVRIRPGQVTTVPMKLGGKGIFKPGQWTVQYLQEQRELIVEIKIDYFRTELGNDVVKGQTHDFFVGSVSEDCQLWWADRFTFPEYIADTKKYHNYKLPFDPNDNPRESLIFEKVQETE
jgi:hypothetical protein